MQQLVISHKGRVASHILDIVDLENFSTCCDYHTDPPTQIIPCFINEKVD